MTINLNTPKNVNPLSPNGFKFSIAALPEIEYFCQQIHIPGITFGDPILANPFANVPIPGDHLTYDTLNVRFLVDENMDNYIAIYNWIVALGFPQSYTQYVNYVSASQSSVLSELASNYSTGVMQVLNNTNNPIKTITFNDMFPIALETLEFQSTNDSVNYLTGSATFRFSYYTFSNVSGAITRI
jgi:hypothetical protein